MMTDHDTPALSASAVPGDTPATREARWRMVREQIAARGIQEPRLLAALRTVPRHLFMPAREWPLAYVDRPVPIGHGQTISQPYIVACMTAVAAPGSQDRVLEIGSGSGYQTAILAALAREVLSIEIVPELAEWSARRLHDLGVANVRQRCADGYAGWPEEAPFDVILVTAAPPEIPPPLLEQLADGGRMVIPVGQPWETQELLSITRAGTELHARQLLPVRFVPLVRGQAEAD